MDALKVDILARDLVRLLQDLIGLHAEVAAHMRHKLDAIKRADSDTMQSLTAREMALVNRAAEREGLARQITQRIVEALGVRDVVAADLRVGRESARRPAGTPAATTLKLTEMAELLPEPRRSQLLVSAAGLRDKLEEIERLRITSALVSQEMLRHLGEVLAVMTAGGPGSDVYSRSGRRERAVTANVFEAVG